MQENPEINVLLQGIVGSTAYGLAGPDSDVDRLGVFATPLDQILSLDPPADSIVTTKPDVTMHEALKMCRLLLKGNPSVTELLWLPEELYEVKTELGEQLIAIRSAFLSASQVRARYLGYARSQFHRLTKHGDGDETLDPRKHVAKHARHLLRLLDQGLVLYQTGEVQVRLANPQRYFDFGEMVARRPSSAEEWLLRAEEQFDSAVSALPSEPNKELVEDWLWSVRHYAPPIKLSVPGMWESDRTE